jgi:hypothetical protein
VSATKTIFELAEDREELIIRLADMVDTIRTAVEAGAAMPVRCLLDCEPRHWTPWGRSDICGNYGTRPLPADRWHHLLVATLPDGTPWLERRAA